MTDTTTTAATRITIEDVRAALADGDPHQTNAARIRATLGRGSMETIQRHLTTLRQQATAAAAATAGADEVPSAPDALGALWLAAWSAARAQVLGRLDKISAERDAAAGAAEALTADLAALAAELDTAAAAEQVARLTAEQAQRDLVEALGLAESAAAAHAAALAAAQAETAAARAETDAVRRDAAQAAALADAGRAAISAEIARLTDQVAELKAALYRRAAEGKAAE